MARTAQFLAEFATPPRQANCPHPHTPTCTEDRFQTGVARFGFEGRQLRLRVSAARPDRDPYPPGTQSESPLNRLQTSHRQAPGRSDPARLHPLQECVIARLTKSP